jgi:pimeloyl-ACP methyl ester carboxylesterase
MPKYGRPALAPAVAKALTPSSLGSIGVPLLLVGGDSDQVAPPATNARYVAAAVPGARFLAVPRAGHYVFLDRCTDRGRQLIPATCVDAEGVDRAHIHEHVVATVARFLRDVLGAP